MLLRSEAIRNHVVPVKEQAVLNKECVMLPIVRDVEMGILLEFGVRLSQVICRIQPICQMNKNCHLVRSPVHALDLVLHLETVILGEVYMQQDGILGQIFQGQVTLLILPCCNKIVRYKLHQFRL
jgi:hypothetical protein